MVKPDSLFVASLVTMIPVAPRSSSIIIWSCAHRCQADNACSFIFPFIRPYNHRAPRLQLWIWRSSYAQTTRAQTLRLWLASSLISMLLLWFVYRCFYLASFLLFAFYFMRVSCCKHLTVSLSCFLLLSCTGPWLPLWYSMYLQSFACGT